MKALLWLCDSTQLSEVMSLFGDLCVEQPHDSVPTLFERASRVGKPSPINSQIGIYMALQNYVSDSSSPFTNMDMRNFHLI